MSDDIVNRLTSETRGDPSFLMGEAADEIARLRDLIGRYVRHVQTEEGTDFLGRVMDGDYPISPAEAREIETYAWPDERSQRR